MFRLRAVSIPQVVTQDTTPSGRIFKARLLHDEEDMHVSCDPFSESSP